VAKIKENIMKTSATHNNHQIGLPVVLDWDRFFSESNQDEDRIICVGSLLSGRFRVTKLIASTADSRIFLATDEFEVARVAVKVLKEESNYDSNVRLKKWGEEAALVRHSNMVCVLGSGWHGDSAFVVMELITGEPLRNYIRKRIDACDEFTEMETIKILTQVCEVCEFMAREGLLNTCHLDDFIVDANGQIVRLGSGCTSVASDSHHINPACLQAAIAQIGYLMLSGEVWNQGSKPVHIIDPVISLRFSRSLQRAIEDESFETLAVFRRATRRPGLPAWVWVVLVSCVVAMGVLVCSAFLLSAVQ